MGHCQQEVWVLSMQDLASECSAAGSVVSPAAMTVQLVDGNFETAFAACRLTVKHVPDDRECLASGDSQGSSYTLDSSKDRGMTCGQCSEREIACELDCIDLQVVASTAQGRHHCIASTLLFAPLSANCGVLEQ